MVKKIQTILGDLLSEDDRYDENLNEISVLITELLRIGISVETKFSSRMRMIEISITENLVPYANKIGQWLKHAIDVSNDSGVLEKVSEKVRITNDLMNRFSGTETKQALTKMMDFIEMINGSGELPSAVKRELQILSNTVKHISEDNPAKNLLEEFLASLPDHTSISFYKDLFTIAEISTSPSIQLVSDATETVRNIGLHVSLAQPKKQKHISIMTLGQNNIWIPCST